MKPSRLLLTLVIIPALHACAPLPAAKDASGYLERGDYAAALKEVEAGLKEHPDDQRLHRMAIHAHMAQGQVRQGVGAYRRYERAEGRDREMLAYLALTTMRWALAHRTPEVRLEGIQAVRRCDAAPLMRDMLRRMGDPNEFVRTWAAVAMSRTPQGAQMLDDQLRSSSPRARALALEWVARIAGDRAVGAVGEAATHSDEEVRVAVARGLAHTGAGGVPVLLTLLTDKAREVRVAAAASLGDLGDNRARPPLVKALQDSYLGVRLAAARALGQLGGDESGPALRTLAGGEDLLTAFSAGRVLHKQGEPQPLLDAIARALQMGDGPTREAACNAAASVKDGAAVLLVARALEDKLPGVRMAAARATRQGGKKARAVGVARVVLKEACPVAELTTACFAAAELLAMEDVKEGLLELQRLATTSKSPALRQQALSASLRLEASQDLALKALEDEAAAVVLTAASWLYKKNK